MSVFTRANLAKLLLAGGALAALIAAGSGYATIANPTVEMYRVILTQSLWWSGGSALCLIASALLNRALLLPTVLLLGLLAFVEAEPASRLLVLSR